MALSSRKKLDILTKAIGLQTLFRDECSSDTGQWRGSDTGSILRTSRTTSAKLAAILNANTQYASEGWYISTKSILVGFGETVS